MSIAKPVAQFTFLLVGLLTLMAGCVVEPRASRPQLP